MNPGVQGYDDPPTDPNPESRQIPDENYNSCQLGINKLQSAIVKFYISNETWIWRCIYLILAVLYFVYFGWAMFYSFGDEGSVRLLVCTVLVVLLAVFNLTWEYTKTPFKQCWDVITSTDNVKRRRIIRWVLYVVALVAIIVILVVDIAIPSPMNLTSLAGLAALLFICFLCSTNPGKVDWHPVFWGLALQFFFAAIILRTEWGYQSFKWLGDRITEFLAHTDAGSEFVFGDFREHFFAFGLMPVITFFGAFISILYHLGIMQAIIRVMGRSLGMCLGTTPAESINAAANIFLGMSAAPIMIAPFIEDMTISELHALMTAGFATVAGASFGIYIRFGVPPNHLTSASVMSAPAALAISKLLCPETEVTAASNEDFKRLTKSESKNVIEAASEGAAMSIRIIATIIVNLIAFMALLAFVNATLIWFGERVGVENFTFEFISSYALFPIALFMGTPIQDCRRVAELVGVKIFTTEIIAYRSLQGLLQNRQTLLNYTVTHNNSEWYWEGQDVVLAKWNMTLKRGFIEERSEVIAMYALCGFSSIAAVAVLLASLTAMAPSRKSDLARIVVRAVVAGNTACFLTACVAGLFFKKFES